MAIGRYTFIIFTALLLTGCAGQKNENRETDMNISQKMDAQLRSLLADADRSVSNEMHAVLIQLSGPPDEDTLQKLRNHQIEIDTIINAIVTARGSANAIRKVAAEPAVVSISLSQKRDPLD
jgi:PBP1b-binding outer membrane lipoprotein LpoB